MLNIQINDFRFFVKSGVSVLNSCKFLGINIPHFCYHEILSVAGNCRMCLVELKNIEKPVASCVTLISDELNINVSSPFVKKARENVMEILLINHPLDCPVCDQGGECDLQEQSKLFGKKISRFFFKKRSVENKYLGPLIKTVMSRCIHCTRCTRFCTEIIGDDFLITLSRGKYSEIGNYKERIFFSEISGNLIDLCPVGALTSKIYAFKTRPWELKVCESFDVLDGLGTSLYINFKDNEIFRILPKKNSGIYSNVISDKARFFYDSQKANRIQNVYISYFDKIRKWKVSDWKKAIDFSRNKLNIADGLENLSKSTFFIDNEVSIDTLNFLQKIKFASFSQLQLRSLNNDVKSKNNFFFQNSVDNISVFSRKFEICFFLSSNPKIENTLINAKIRHRFKNNVIKVFSSCRVFDSSFSMLHINLDILFLLKILEGKNLYSIFFLKHCLFCFGENLSYSFSNLEFLTFFIKDKFSNIKILILDSAINKWSLRFFNISPYNKKEILIKRKINFFFNLKDTVELRSIFGRKHATNFSIWLNTHGSKAASFSDLILPTFSVFETINFFFNLEQKVQKTNLVFNSFFDARDINLILETFFLTKKKKSKYLCYLIEIANTHLLFDTIINCYFYSLLEKKYTRVFRFPVKSCFEDFYIHNKLAKQSLVLSNCSQMQRNHFFNFI
jgi:NADH-quinone oxidoreductase subunit G